jgi:1,2-diacylglycerol 3-alpha-glucosyltransferase
MAEAEASLTIAIACSGLGRIRRGNEAWAQDLARALIRRGVPVTLFGADAVKDAAVTIVSCLGRTDTAARRLARFFSSLGGWRYGFGSAYEIEQTTFAINLWRKVWRGYDILHVQDAVVATIMDRLNRLGLCRARVILANGTGEPAEHLRRLSFVQLLSPGAAQDWVAHKPSGQLMFSVPNFVDLAIFQSGDRGAARRRFELPGDALIILCCAAIRKVHKRIDYLIREFAAFAESEPGRPIMLVIAGGREAETDELVALGRELLGDRVRFLVDLPRSRMPDLYRAADMFVLVSLAETFGIVLVEALATGLPIICHDSEHFRFVTGPASVRRDFARPGALGAALGEMSRSDVRQSLAEAARTHARDNFAEDVVVRQIVEMYHQVATDKPRAADG